MESLLYWHSQLALWQQILLWYAIIGLATQFFNDATHYYMFKAGQADPNCRPTPQEMKKNYYDHYNWNFFKNVVFWPIYWVVILAAFLEKNNNGDNNNIDGNAY